MTHHGTERQRQLWLTASVEGYAGDWPGAAASALLEKRGAVDVGESPIMPSFPNLAADQSEALVDYMKHPGS